MQLKFSLNLVRTKKNTGIPFPQYRTQITPFWNKCSLFRFYREPGKVDLQLFIKSFFPFTSTGFFPLDHDAVQSHRQTNPCEHFTKQSRQSEQCYINNNLHLALKVLEFLSAMASINKLNKKTHWLRSKRINTHDLLLSTLSVFGISVKGRLYTTVFLVMNWIPWKNLYVPM